MERFWGFSDAVRTPTGPDGGSDVNSGRAVAQVKAHYRPVGRLDVQNLFGVAAAHAKIALFFALSSYTPEAVVWGDQVGMALFRFDMQCAPEPVNAVAGGIASNRSGSTVVSPSPAAAVPGSAGGHRRSPPPP